MSPNGGEVEIALEAEASPAPTAAPEEDHDDHDHAEDEGVKSITSCHLDGSSMYVTARYVWEGVELTFLVVRVCMGRRSIMWLERRLGLQFRRNIRIAMPMMLRCRSQRLYL